MPHSVRSVLASALLLLLTLTAEAASAPDAGGSTTSPEVRRLLDLIEHRARLMPDVARWKWHRQRPVSDPARERRVLEAATRTAAASGLEQTGAARFVEAQMRIARSVQAARFERWRERPPAAGGPDLIADLRPAISATTTELLATLPRVLPLLTDRADDLDADLDRRLTPLGADRAAVRGLAEALSDLETVAVLRPGLRGILERGTLRIGTTGDYAPFTAIDEDGERIGIDIDLARILARSLEVEPVFVDTSWPTLMDDLQAGQFDIAMSGISRTTDRARIADFGDAYHVGGKTPIVRCTDRDALDRLERIDRPDVRVIVNPGGTNERFARATLTRAPLRVFDDNTAIFDEIAEGRADLMFTDAIEVRLRTARDPRLCAAMPGRTLTYQEKGFLLPRDDDGAWRRYLNLWLAGIRGDGTLERVFASHLKD
jgi:cyclohexadienyl dehydratase